MNNMKFCLEMEERLREFFKDDGMSTDNPDKYYIYKRTPKTKSNE